MTRLQENTMERLGIKHGRLAVREGYADKHVELTAPCGELFHVDEGGVSRQQPGGDFSVDWGAR